MPRAELPYLDCPPLVRAAYGQWFTDPAIWGPYVSHVAHKHDLVAPGAVSVGVPGSHPVFLTDRGYVVKFFAPHWPHNPDSEMAVYRVLAQKGAVGVGVPRLIAAGDLFDPRGGRWPWPYIVISTVPGRSVGELRDALGDGDLTAMARGLGPVVRSLHALPVPPEMTGASAARVAEWRQTAVERRRAEGGWPHSLLDALPQYLDATLGPTPWALGEPPPCLVHADLTQDHVLLSRRGEGWEISGVIDFADAEAIDPAYELVALHVDLFRCDKALLKAFIHAHGGEAVLGDGWRRRATAFVLIFPFDLSRTLAERVSGWDAVRTPLDLEAALWPAP